MFKCDLCDKKMEMGEGKILHDKFRNKNVLYCQECFDDYEIANESWKDMKEMKKSSEYQLASFLKR